QVSFKAAQIVVGDLGRLPSEQPAQAASPGRPRAKPRDHLARHRKAGEKRQNSSAHALSARLDLLAGHEADLRGGTGIVSGRNLVAYVGNGHLARLLGDYVERFLGD